MGYNSQQKLHDNIAAIRIALEWKEGQSLSDKHVQTLQRYAGFGGLKAVLYPNATKEEWIKLKASKEDLKLYPQIIEIHQLLQQHFNEAEYKQAIDSIKNSILTAFYTPEIVPQSVFNVLKEQGIEPKNIYEPSSGAGVFVTEAALAFTSIENITAIEKDILSGRVLTALGSSIPVPVSVQITGFENTSDAENDKYDLIVSNIPFGNFPVFDKAFKDQAITGKIHNYFFAKGLDKIKDGGLLAYITTDAFLNSPSNQGAREYLFNHANFISLNVMPDNLVKDTSNTEAPSHLLIAQKNIYKNTLSEKEQLLVATSEQENVFGKYSINQFIHQHPEIILGDEIKPGKNQYGKAHQTVWQNGNINDIKEKIAAKSIAFKQYVYKLYSNVAEVQFPANWMNASAIHLELNGLSNRLQEYNHQFHNEGEGLFHVSFNNKEEQSAELIDLNPYYKEGTLVVHNNRVGFVSDIDAGGEQRVFIPSLYEKKDVGFYQQYTAVRAVSYT